MSNSEAENSGGADKTDGIIWQTTKPKLISRNLSTGNLQSLERRVSESTGFVAARPEQPSSPMKGKSRRSSLSSLFLGQTPPVVVQRGPSESFFKELIEKYDMKEEQSKKTG